MHFVFCLIGSFLMCLVTTIGLIKLFWIISGECRCVSVADNLGFHETQRLRLTVKSQQSTIGDILTAHGPLVVQGVTNQFYFPNSKGEGDKILAFVKLRFTPDDDSPADPIQLLRNSIQGSDSPKRSSITGILHGEKVQLVNATMIVGKCFENVNTQV